MPLKVRGTPAGFPMGKPKRNDSTMTAVGFEPTPFRTGAWSQRLRPLGQTVLMSVSNLAQTCKNPLPSCKQRSKDASSVASTRAQDKIEEPRLHHEQRTCVTAVGFEPTPLRTGALSQRLRPLGQTVMPCRRRQQHNKSYQ